MALKLETLRAGIGTRTVVVRGQEQSMRIITGAERSRIEAAFLDMPEAPRRRDPKKGSLAPEVADTNDPEYVRLRAEALRINSCMVIAAALDIEDSQGNSWRVSGESVNVLRQLGRELHELLTPIEIHTLGELAAMPLGVQEIQDSFRGAPEPGKA